MKAAGRRTNALVEFVDLYPTLADLAGLPVPKVLEGRSLKPLLNNAEQTGKPAAFSQYPRGRRMGYSMRTNRWRYTEWIDRSTGKSTAHELYDHEQDPGETVNVAQEPRHSKLTAQLSKQLRAAVLPKARPSKSTSPAIGFDDCRRYSNLQNGKSNPTAI